MVSTTDDAATRLARDRLGLVSASGAFRPIRLSVVAASRTNNFDLLRLLAACLVLGSHSFPLTGRHEPLAPHTLGAVGVEMFFAISGFLVTASWLNEPAVGAFLRKRALRIFPGLICAVVVTALVFGTVFTASSRAAFLGSPAPWSYIAFSVFLFPVYILKSVFTGNPDQAANGSLWTLPVEARTYLLLGLCGLGGLVRGRVVGVTAIALVAVNATVDLGPSLRLASMFVAGSALYLLRGRVILRADIAALLFVIWLAAFGTTFATAVGMLAIPYLVACAAYCTPRGLRRLTAKGDVSYGVYVYAFPIQQALVATLGPVNPFLLTAIAAPLVWFAGLVSWRLIEQPMLKRKRRTRAQREHDVVGAPLTGSAG
jgi:peptidoglycan/LPS O-acetylase OafA/YrhL